MDKYVFGPALLPTLLLCLIALAVLALWLLASGLRLFARDGISWRCAWHLALGTPLAGYLVAVAIAAVVS